MRVLVLLLTFNWPFFGAGNECFCKFDKEGACAHEQITCHGLENGCVNITVEGKLFMKGCSAGWSSEFAKCVQTKVGGSGNCIKGKPEVWFKKCPPRRYKHRQAREASNTFGARSVVFPRIADEEIKLDYGKETEWCHCGEDLCNTEPKKKDDGFVFPVEAIIMTVLAGFVQISGYVLLIWCFVMVKQRRNPYRMAIAASMAANNQPGMMVNQPSMTMAYGQQPYAVPYNSYPNLQQPQQRASPPSNMATGPSQGQPQPPAVVQAPS